MAVSPGNDTLRGGTDNDVLVSGDGDDDCDGGYDDDTINGGDGDDTLVGDKGNDRIRGGRGNDKIWGDDVAGVWTGSDIDVNADNIEGGEGYNTIYGGPGYDVIYAISEAAGVLGNSWGDQDLQRINQLRLRQLCLVHRRWRRQRQHLRHSRPRLSRRWFRGRLHRDRDGGDFVNAGPGNDGVIVSAGPAEVYLGDGNDVVDGGNDNNWIEGGPGDDRIFARDGEDVVYGGSTARSYELRQLDEAHRPIVDPLHGGFSATVRPRAASPILSSIPRSIRPHRTR